MISISPVNSQLQVRDADVVLSAIELNLGLRKGEKDRDKRRGGRGTVMMDEKERGVSRECNVGEKLWRKWMFTEAGTLLVI